MRARQLWTIMLTVGLLCAISAPADGACGLSLGDRVQLTVDHPDGHPTLLVGHRGTVICFDEWSFTGWVLVSWDDWTAGHENVWFCTTPVLPHVNWSCWWVMCAWIEPVKPGVPDIADGGEPDRSFRPQAFIAGKANQPLEVSFNVVNGGTGSPQDAIYVDVYASKDTSITPSDYYLGTVNCFISAGGSLQKTLKMSLPTKIPAGYYYIGWIMDPLDLIPEELDETNNTAYVNSYRLLVSGATGTPCLELSAACGGKIATPGEGVFTYPSAKQVSVAAVADAGCFFACWAGTAVDAGKVADPKAASTQVMVDAKYSLTALFGGPHLLLEDFEDYNDASPVNGTWVDGLGWHVGDPQGHRGNQTGAIIGNAEAPTPGNPTVHGGVEAMAFDYDNRKSPYYSEASRRWPTLQNWAATGADKLSIWYRGPGSNGVQPLYVVVEDFHRKTAVIKHPDSLAVRNSQWTQWLVPLQQIQDAGVMLSRIIRVHLGVGDSANPLVGGAGTLYFDDITLAQTGSGGAPPGGQPPVVPAIDSPIAHWKLDETSGSIAHDSAGAHSGQLYGSPTWLPAGGVLSGALRFNGMSYVEIPPSTDFDIPYTITVAAWINVAVFDKSWQAIVTKGDSSWRIQRDSATSCIEFACTGANVPGNSWGSLLGHRSVNDGQWHHVAGIYDGARITLYVDGVLDVSASAPGRISTNTYPVLIGENAEQRGRWWNGLVDDVRIYDQALSAGDIRALTTAAGPEAGR